MIDSTLASMVLATEDYLAEIVEQFEDVGNPEKLLEKPYDQWTMDDFNMLTYIYGDKEPNALTNLIFKREYNKVKELESEEV